MTSSNSRDRLRSIPGNTPPDARDTGNFTRLRGLAFGSLRITVSPSSISEVKVRPSFVARFLARFRRSSLILTVVLIHQSIWYIHQYVKTRSNPGLKDFQILQTQRRNQLELLDFVVFVLKLCSLCPFYDLDWFRALLLVLVFSDLLSQRFFHLAEFAAGIVELRSAVRQLIFIGGQRCNPLCT